MQAVILAGGQGTRLQPFTFENPKPMYPVQGRPYLDRLLDQVVSFGITDVILLLGYKAEKIIEHFKMNPRPELKLQFNITPEYYETGARLKAASDLICGDFLLMYCDNYCPITFQEHIKSFQENGSLVHVTAYANRDGYTRNNMSIREGKVTVYDKSRQAPGLNAVDIGYALIARSTLDWLDEKENQNFERVVYEKARQEGRMSATITEHRYYSIGSFSRMELTEQFFSHRKAVFLDRDGTLNVRPPKACYVEDPSDFVWLDGAKEAIKLLNDAGYLVFLVTNQPGIARKRLTEQTLHMIHEKVSIDLLEIGAHIDKIYVCPHDWDEGCLCRKPKPGLLYQAQQEYNLNIPEDCVLFGDDERDITAAHKANCWAVMVSDSYPLINAVRDFLNA